MGERNERETKKKEKKKEKEKEREEEKREECEFWERWKEGKDKSAMK